MRVWLARTVCVLARTVCVTGGSYVRVAGLGYVGATGGCVCVWLAKAVCMLLTVPV